MRSMVEGVCSRQGQVAPSTAYAAKPAQAAQACLRWAVPLARAAGEDEFSHEPRHEPIEDGHLAPSRFAIDGWGELTRRVWRSCGHIPDGQTKRT